MLEAMDAFMCFIIPAIFYVLFVGAAIAGCIAAIVALFSPNTIGVKLNWIGVAFVTIAVCGFFLGWVGESTWTSDDAAFAAYSNPSFPDYSWLTVIGPGIISLIVFAIALFLRSVGIPLIIVGTIYMGILMFGI